MNGVPVTWPHVVGIDLSLTCTGMAVHGRTMRIERPSRQLNMLPELQRLRWMRDSVLNELRHGAAVARRGTDLVVLEGLAYSRTTGRASTRAGLWWLVREALDVLGLPVAVVPPTTRARYATGKGTAGKDDVIREVTKRFPWFAGRNDEADAVILGCMGADHLGAPWVSLPATHRAALAAVEWPEVARA